MSLKSCVAGVVLGAIVTLSLLSTTGTRSMADDTKSQQKLVHNVYFTLKDGSPENIRKLTDACYKYLDKHDGVVAFAAGTVVAELDRPVNQRDFHVCLSVIFKDKAAHDVYQTHPRHIDFINENKETWASVRVFDSWAR